MQDATTSIPQNNTLIHSMRILSLLLLIASATLCHGQSIELVFAGDAMQHERQLKAAKQADKSYDYTPYYRALHPYIQSADYAVVNLETPLGGAPYSGYPMFCAPDSYLSALKQAGFDLMLTANNHALDRHDKGVRRTIKAIQKEGLPWVGTYSNKAQRDSILPLITDINGFKIAFLNYTYGTNGISIQGNVVVDYIDRPLMAKDVKKARERGAEIVVVAIHWGDEYKLLPNNTQRSLADYLTDLGVDLIIGGHPHVIQPMEIRHSKKHDKDVFLCYSLGNLISAMRKDDTRGGALARVTIERNPQGKAVVKEASYRTVFVLPPDDTNKSFRIVPAEDAGYTPEAEENKRQAFVNNATEIFDKHNVKVPLDTLTMEQYLTRIILKQMP